MATAFPEYIPSNQYRIPETMKAWVLGGPEELVLVEKPVPQPGPAEVFVRVDAIAVCATDIGIIRHGVPAMIDGGLPFNRGFTPGHEYMGTIVTISRMRCSALCASSCMSRRLPHSARSPLRSGNSASASSPASASWWRASI